MKRAMKKCDVTSVFREKNMFVTPHFVVRWRKTDLAFSRVTFAFARSAGNAVTRNRYKRRLRELVLKVGVCVGIDFVFSARKPLATLTSAEWLKQSQRVVRFCEETQKHANTPSA